MASAGVRGTPPETVASKREPSLSSLRRRLQNHEKGGRDVAATPSAVRPQKPLPPLRLHEYHQAACYGHCCLTDPGRDQLASGEGRLTPPAATAAAAPSRRRRDAWAGGASVCVEGEEEEEEEAEGKRALRERRDRRRSLLMRSGRCSICR